MERKELSPQLDAYFTTDELARLTPDELARLDDVDLDELAASHALELAAYRQQLAAPSSLARVDAADQVGGEALYELLPELEQLLHDDAPYLFQHGEHAMISEVRARALSALERMYRRSGRRPDFGQLSVRKGMAAVEAHSRAAEGLARCSAAEQERLLRRVDEFLITRVNPEPAEREALRDYRVLQELGLIEYRHETVDPVTYLTPLQEEVRLSQVRGQRPCPYLRVASLVDRKRTLGFVYRDVQSRQWAIDFAECDEAEEAADWVREMMTLDPGGVPRVQRDRQGQPLRDAEGGLLYDGVIPLETRDEVALLQCIHSLISERYHGDLRPNLLVPPAQ